MLLLALGLPTVSEPRWLVRASAGDDVSEEAAQARKDAIDVAGKTVPADEHVRDEVATASERRHEDTDCAFIVPLLLERHVLCAQYPATQSMDRHSSNCPTQTE